MKCFSYGFLFFIFTFLACNDEPVQKSEPRLIESRVPFYAWNDTLQTQFYYGVQTEKFIYVRNFEGAWLLYDKRIETSQLINVAGLDEYIFIQSELEFQLKELLKIRKYNRNFINIKSFPWKK